MACKSSVPVECSLCGFFSPNLTQHVSHLRLVHSQDPNFSTDCGIGSCSKRFSTFAAFNTHIYRHHRSELGLQLTVPLTLNTPLTAEEFLGVRDDQEIVSSFDRRSDQEFSSTYTCTYCPEASHKEINAKLLLSLTEGHRLSEVAVQDVIAGCRNVSTQTATHLTEVVRNKLIELEVDFSVIEQVDQEITNSVVDPFEGLGTSHFRNKYFKEQFHYLEPQEISFGEPYYVERFSGAKRQKVLTSDKFYYVPLLETLKLLLTQKDVQKEVTSLHQSGSKLEDFCDGSMYKTHPLFTSDPLALQVIGYYDELEVVNPIGSYVKKHKLGCLFFTLGNIRPQFRSTLKAIYVLAIGRNQDISKYGLDALLAPFVDDLKTLYLDGITVDIGGKECTFHGGLLAFLADNLAAHLVGGFKGSFSFARRICRSCMITTDLAQECFVETNCQLRSAEEHEEQCEYLNGPLYNHFSVNFGINRRSIMEDVPGFSVATCMPHDIMHDLFEGAVPLELKLLMAHCVQCGYFTIPELNSRMERYDFSENRPCLIDPAVIRNPTKGKVRQTASQMSTLLHEFPLLVGDKVPRDDKHWQSLMLLLRICKIALAPFCTRDTIPYLSVLIEEKLSVFSTLYPDAKIIPKLHYMVHLPTQIQLFGPLVHSWCMRQEAKLSFIKKASQRGNFKNICKTVISKHQLWLCYMIECNTHLLYPKVELSAKVSCVTFAAEPAHIQDELMNIAPFVCPDTSVNHPKWINVHSVTYNSGTFVLLKYDEMEPKFGKILDIITVDSDDITVDSDDIIVLFFVQVYLAYAFDSHYDAFVVKSTGRFVYVPLGNLAHYRPVNIRKGFSVSDANLYISLHCTY